MRSKKQLEYFKKYEESLTDITIVKTTSSQIFKRTSDWNKICNTVFIATNIVKHTYAFIKLYSLHCFEEYQEIPTITVPFIKTTMKVLSKRVNTGVKPKKEIQKLYDELNNFYKDNYQDILPEKFDMTHMNTILDYEAISILTNYKNHITGHFIGFLNRYVNILVNKSVDEKELKDKYNGLIKKLSSSNANYRKDKKRLKEELKLKLSELRKNIRIVKKDIIEGIDTDNIKYKKIKEDVRKLLPLEALGENLNECVEKDPLSFLKTLIKMSRDAERLTGKSINCFPLRRTNIPKYVRFDTTSLLHILYDNKAKYVYPRQYYLTDGNTRRLGPHVWSLFFRTERKIFKKNDYTFNNQIMTDGYGVSLVFVKSEKYGKKIYGMKKPNTYSSYKYIDDIDDAERDTLKDLKIVGIDPGKSDLIFSTDGSTYKNKKGKDKVKTFRYSQNQRRYETKSKYFSKYMDNLKKETMMAKSPDDNNLVSIKKLENELSAFNSKTCYYDKFREYVDKKKSIDSKVSNFYEQEIVRKFKFAGFRHKKKSEAKMVNNFKNIYGDNKKAVICIGDWSPKKQMKFCEPTKGKGMRDIFRKAGYKVYLVKEYMTSKMNYYTKKENEKFRIRRNPKPYRDGSRLVHGLLRSKSVTYRNNQNVLINRDLNGALNIREIAICAIRNLERPDWLIYKPSQ